MPGHKTLSVAIIVQCFIGVEINPEPAWIRSSLSHQIIIIRLKYSCLYINYFQDIQKRETDDLDISFLSCDTIDCIDVVCIAELIKTKCRKMQFDETNK